MVQKYTEIVAFKVDETTNASINNLLDQYNRTQFATKADLLRELLGVGLQKHWNKINKKNADK